MPAHNLWVTQAELFHERSALPPGLRYVPEFLGREEEAQLLTVLRTLPFEEAPYREWRARRRMVAFGGRYDFTHQRLEAAPPLPEFLWPLRSRVAAWARLPCEDLQQALINEYRPGTPLGWHRDAPHYESVAGVSLQGHARLRFRPWPPKPRSRRAVTLEVEPRSAYLMQGEARWGWQHSVPATRELRYSITFRSRRP